VIQGELTQHKHCSAPFLM